MRGGKPRQAKRSWNFASISWTSHEKAPRQSRSFWKSSRSASFWPPAAATRITESSTAASRSSLPFWKLAVRDRRARHRRRDRNRRSRRTNVWPRLRGHTQLIVSYHNFEATPPMDSVISRVMRAPADAYKIVTTARKPSDNARVLAAAKALPKHRMVVLAMGELGFRRACFRRSSAASSPTPRPCCAKGTAAGQVSARYLRHLYRVEKLQQDRQDLRRDRRSGAPFDFAGRA